MGRSACVQREREGETEPQRHKGHSAGPPATHFSREAAKTRRFDVCDSLLRDLRGFAWERGWGKASALTSVAPWWRGSQPEKLDTPTPSPEHDDGMTQRRCAVLIVEDDDKLQDLLRTLIARHCTSVDVAADGERGIEMLRAGTYDAVIVDLMLPKKNGLLVI